LRFPAAKAEMKIQPGASTLAFYPCSKEILRNCPRKGYLAVRLGRRVENKSAPTGKQQALAWPAANYQNFRRAHKCTYSLFVARKMGLSRHDLWNPLKGKAHHEDALAGTCRGPKRLPSP
jgi:hypothetical protein